MQGLDVHWPWVILTELEHGSSRDQDCVGKDLDLQSHQVQLNTMFLSVQIVVTEKEDASYAIHQCLPSLFFFFPYFLQAFHRIEMYLLAATFPQSTPFLSPNCLHFCTTQPAVTILLRMVNRSIHYPAWILISVTFMTSPHECIWEWSLTCRLVACSQAYWRSGQCRLQFWLESIPEITPH